MALVDKPGVEAGADGLDGAAGEALDAVVVLVEAVADFLGADVIDVVERGFLDELLLAAIDLAAEAADAGLVVR